MSVRRFKNGHISRDQFRRSLTMAELHCSVAEMQAIEARYCNDYGVNYASFLEEIEPAERPPARYVERMKDIRLANEKKRTPERRPVKDLENVLLKIKTKVM